MCCAMAGAVAADGIMPGEACSAAVVRQVGWMVFLVGELPVVLTGKRSGRTWGTLGP